MGKMGFIFTAAIAIVIGTIINYSIASDSESGTRAPRGYISGGGYSGGGGGHK